MRERNIYRNLFYNIRGRLKLSTYEGLKCDFTDWRELRNYVISTIGEKPEGMTLDRKNNNLGYVRGNLRWATRLTQQRNRRPQFNTQIPKSGFKYVTQYKGGYRGQFKHKSVSYYTGYSMCPATVYLKTLAMRSFVVQ